jgi:predicted nucleic acid-binding protein
VLELAKELDLDTYDAEYLSLAKSLGLQLITTTQELADAVPETVITLASIE